jgi:hypothetical protein
MSVTVCAPHFPSGKVKVRFPAWKVNARLGLAVSRADSHLLLRDLYELARHIVVDISQDSPCAPTNRVLGKPHALGKVLLEHEAETTSCTQELDLAPLVARHDQPASAGARLAGPGDDTDDVGDGVASLRHAQLIAGLQREAGACATQWRAIPSLLARNAW